MKHCPECNIEYVDSATSCSDCLVDLVPGPPVDAAEANPAESDEGFESVYKTENPALVAIAKSVLEDAQIEYYVEGDANQDYAGGGGFAGLGFAIRPVEFLVSSEDAVAARELLADLEDTATDELPDEDPAP